MRKPHRTFDGLEVVASFDRMSMIEDTENESTEVNNE